METNDKNQTTKVKTESNKNPIAVVILVILMLAIVAFTIAYSRFIANASGNAKVKIAEMICEMEVTPNHLIQGEENAINPYCIVKVKNYKYDTQTSQNKISQTDVNFKIEVTPKEGFILPEYYWLEENTVIAENEELTGKLVNGSLQEKTYKIVFKNSGEGGDGQVDFNLVANQ